ncbi:hypothetical protein ABZ626_28315 [Streptomyces longispororuber]|uniref:hypothetical protein n=1 Tax=Streptomyces longispororuber TaxID=68230 RepID=UPI0033C6F0D2
MCGIDVGTGLLRACSWRWLKIRILGLLSAESRLARHFAPSDEQAQRLQLSARARGRTEHAT